ncbi:hypothetical protein [Nocardioides sp. InS609-2]|uniref:hypothetical protein n=1 Tax=Nocardioides sp. InS609-2 TaxID=2760705 RepID=UPI0020BDBE5C|nr:hypothetical protein [Nocardioides sp. InS609-2]
MTERADLAAMSGPEAVEWLMATFSVDPTIAGGRPDARAVLPFIRHGITDTAFITAQLSHAGVLATLPDGVLIDTTEFETFVLVGAKAWLEDPDNRSEWRAIGNAAHQHDAMMSEHQRHNRRAPSGDARRHLRSHEVVTAFLDAGRGPSYAWSVITTASRHRIEIDAFGFGAEITPASYEDLASAGVARAADLDAYLRAGLTLPEAIAFRHDGIPPAAVLMAKAEGHPPERCHEILVGLPEDWFRPLGDRHYGTDEGGELTHHLRTGGNDRYTLADLRYLVEHGWTEKDDLGPRGVAEIPMYGGGDTRRGATAAMARRLADHGLTWTSTERWADALTTGKAGARTKYDATTPPLVGFGHRRGLAAIPERHLDGLIALHEAGLRPSHLNAYRKAGCRSIDDVLTAHRRGITAALADQLCQEYGRQPDRHRKTRLIDSLDALLRHHAKHASAAS